MREGAILELRHTLRLQKASILATPCSATKCKHGAARCPGVSLATRSAGVTEECICSASSLGGASACSERRS